MEERIRILCIDDERNFLMALERVFSKRPDQEGIIMVLDSVPCG